MDFSRKFCNFRQILNAVCMRSIHSKKALPTPRVGCGNKMKSFPSFIKKGYSPSILEGEYAVLPAQVVPHHIRRPVYADNPTGDPLNIGGYGNRGAEQPPPELETKDEDAIEKMRKVNVIANNALRLAVKNSKEGVTSEDIDHLVHEFITSQNAYPAGINFHMFPKSICASPNEVACHGIPDLRPFQDGDIIKFDITVYYDGYFGDCAATVCIGNVSQVHSDLVNYSLEAFMNAVAVCGPDVPYREIGRAIDDVLKNSTFSVVSEFCGHFIGSFLHQNPVIQHSFPNGHDEHMKPGHTFTIEPIICEGDTHLRVWHDTWTMVTCDNGRSAQWEKVILITGDGYEILH